MRRFVLSLSVLLTLALISLPVLSQDVISTAIGGGPNNIPALMRTSITPSASRSIPQETSTSLLSISTAFLR